MKFERIATIGLLSILGSFSPLLLDNVSTLFPASPALAQTVESRKTEADRLFNRGIEQAKVSQFQKALQSWQKALTIHREIGDREGEASCVNNLGIAYQNLGDYPKAIENYQQSLAIDREIGNRKGVANSLNNLGNAYHALGDYRKAIEYHQQSLAIAREIGDRLGEANSLGNLGTAYDNLGDYPKAIENYQQSLAIDREIGERQGEAYSLNNLGLAYNSLGDYQKAIEYYHQSLTIAREIGDRSGVANSLGNLGSVYTNLGDYPKAIEYHQQSLVIKREIGDRSGVANSLNNLGLAYDNLGDYPKAIEYHQQSLVIKREIGNRKGVANSLNNLGLAYDNLGDYPKAIEYHQQSLTIAREIGDRSGEANSLNNLGIAYDNLGDYPKAIEYYQQSLVIKREIGDRSGEASSLGNLGNGYGNLGDYRKAIEYHQQSLVIKREIGDRSGEAHSLGNLGNGYGNLGDYRKAIDFYQQSLTIAQEIGERQGEGNLLNNLGYALFKSGNLKQAETTLTKAMEIRESLRPGLLDNHKISLSEKQSNTYRILQQVLIAQNKTDAALEIAERGRARALAELLAKGLSPERDTPLNYPNLKKIKQVAQQQKATLVEYSIILDGGISIWVIQPTGKIEWRSAKLPPNTSLKDLINQGYDCLGDHGQCRSSQSSRQPSQGDWVKLKDDQFQEPWQVVEVNAQQGNLRLKLPGWEEGVTIERPITDVARIVDSPNIEKPRLQQLHKLLIEPIADLLPKDENARVVFIPHRELFSVPFPALQDQEGNYLIEKHTILTAPSIEVLGLTHQKRKDLPNSGQTALVVGNPTMPKVPPAAGEKPQQLSALKGAEKEAKYIASELKAQPLLGQDATETKVKGQMPKARYIHFATHGLFDPKRIGGIGSAIALAPSNREDGLLTAEEIFTMELSAELVVVSACETGVGHINSEGVIGLSRSLVAAGVPSVMVSLWSIPDDKTTELMTEFYQNLKNTGDKAQALRQAMLTMIPKSPNPKDWAAFTLIGEAN
ncbi:CHAT domain-containing tetratricopeptide repeat protein [Moorena sp. SIO4G3]|uniref:CHAT domain-containing tetratricopeptide repeat protein n=1 Tax=Moorena sp. SIO4G3 TaxID=2607821 RepID=UPI00142986F5|nr:CHAT domain-containing tetratricopeptide repeat protein [Moorena sp. SIO4G3]NEO74840.1 tetratricopeptide repeat protein [Moorena sp. SIO4G3]